jgi:hypothetical protein
MLQIVYGGTGEIKMTGNSGAAATRSSLPVVIGFVARSLVFQFRQERQRGRWEKSGSRVGLGREARDARVPTPFRARFLRPRVNLQSGPLVSRTVGAPREIVVCKGSLRLDPT